MSDMGGASLMRGVSLILGLVGAVGCVPVYPGQRTPPSVPSQPTESPELGSRYDRTNTGTIRGVVEWLGERPKLAPQLGAVPKGQGQFEFREFPHPFQPQLHDRRVAQVLVELMGVDPSRSKPMNFAPLQIVLNDAQMQLTSGGQPTTVAIAPVGAKLEAVNQDPLPHNLQGRGADFFALSLPAGAAPRTRILTKPGRLDLRSGLGYFWHAATVQVVEHPYYTVTNQRGEYELTEVPVGQYQIRFLLENWTIIEQGRDPESGLIFRQRYAEPWSIIKPVTVARQQTVSMNATLPH